MRKFIGRHEAHDPVLSLFLAPGIKKHDGWWAEDIKVIKQSLVLSIICRHIGLQQQRIAEICLYPCIDKSVVLHFFT